MISGIFAIPLAASTQQTLGASPALPAASSSFPADRSLAFVAGPENGLIRNLAGDVRAETLSYNPLVLVGGTGLGKTTLLQALSNARQNAWPALQVVASSAADFARGYNHAVETNSLGDWRARHQRAGILALDDLHGLANKPGPQQELCTSIDTLVRRGSLVLLALRRTPAEVRGLHPSLVSRLSAGLIVPLALPEAEARRALVEQLSRQLQIPLTREVVLRLADAPRGKRPIFATPVQLKHAVLQLAHLAQSSATNIDVQLVDQLVHNHTPETKGTLRQIAVAVAKHHQLPVQDLKSESRQQNVVRARSLAMFLCRELTGGSYAEVGRFFGGRDHTTVLHACRKISAQILEDVALRELAEDLATQLALAAERT